MGGGMRPSRRRDGPYAFGVFVAGVPGHRFWAGLGVTLQKSAKLKAAVGVPKAKSGLPGVLIMDEEGKGVCLLGGVVGGCISGDDLLARIAGEGDDARYRSRSAPSVPRLL